MAKSTHSERFETFLAGLNAPITPATLDEYEGIGALHLLRGAERTEAEDLLITKLAKNDGRAAVALADIGCTRAIPALRACLVPVVPATMRLFAALALHRLGDDGGKGVVIDVYQQASAGPERTTAESILGEFSGPDVDAALEEAATGPRRSGSAILTLLRVHGLGAYANSYLDRLTQVSVRMMSPLAAVRAPAQAELRELLQRHAGGESPAALGLTWHADDERVPVARFVASLQTNEAPWQADYALDALDAFDAHERAWAEDLLLGQLHRDPRAARALAHLGSARARAPLQELARGGSGALAEAAAAALTRLDGQK